MNDPTIFWPLLFDGMSTYANLVRIFTIHKAELLLITVNGTDRAERVLLRGWPDAGQ